ncbi:MAG: ATP-grasp domain-containing protein [Patescibacteria group bacterium]
MQINNFCVGVLPKGLDDLIQALVFSQKQVFYFTEEGSPEAQWISEFLSRKQILYYHFSTRRKNFDKHSLENILKYSDLTQLLKKRRIKYLVFSNALSNFLEKWSKANKLKIIASPYHFQKSFENKIYFDAFLERNGIPKPKSCTYNHSKNSKIFSDKMVLQKAGSWGAEGTFFLKNKNDLKKLLTKNKIRRNENCLLREHISGKSYGITVFISPKIIAISSLREQHFYECDQSCEQNFAGIQWVAGKNISAQLMLNINQVFARLGELFHQEKFLGYANFDFIIDRQNKIYLIECNPRFAASSLQLLRFPRLISDIQTEKLFINDFIEKSDFAKPKVYLADSQNDFEGANLQIKVAPKTKIVKDYRNGLYEYKNGRAIYKDPDIRKFSQQGKELIFHSNTSLGRFYPETLDAANVITNFPLFGKGGQLNKLGRKIIETFSY